MGMIEEMRTMKAAAQALLSSPATPEEKEMLLQYGISEENSTRLLAIMAKVIQQAEAGDMDSVKFLCEILEENTQS